METVLKIIIILVLSFFQDEVKGIHEEIEESVQKEEELNYDDDSFEDDDEDLPSCVESIKTDDGLLNNNNSISEYLSEIDYGEVCDESVADIESDDESDKSGLFFGAKQNVVNNNSNKDLPVLNPKTSSTLFDEPLPQTLSPITSTIATPVKKVNSRHTKSSTKNKSNKKIITAADIFGTQSSNTIEDDDDDELNSDIDAILGCL